MIVDSLLEETLLFLLNQQKLAPAGRHLRDKIRGYLTEFVERDGAKETVWSTDQERMIEILDHWLMVQHSTHCAAAFDKALQSATAAKTMYRKYKEFDAMPNNPLTRARFFQFFSRARIQRLK